MTYGLQIENQSGKLVIDSDNIAYRFHSSPAVYSAGSISSAVHTPYTFRVTLSSAAHTPIVFVKPEINKVVALGYVERVPATSATWQIEVYSVSISSFAEDMRNTAMAVPTIYVFSPMEDSGSGYGMKLYNSSNVVTFDTSYKPMWIRGVYNFPARSGYNHYNAGWVNGSFFNYDTVSISGFTSIAVLGSTRADGHVWDINFTGETGDNWSYGWTLINSTTLARHRFWLSSDKPAHTLNWSTDDVYFDYYPATALCIEASGL